MQSGEGRVGLCRMPHRGHNGDAVVPVACAWRAAPTPLGGVLWVLRRPRRAPSVLGYRPTSPDQNRPATDR